MIPYELLQKAATKAHISRVGAVNARIFDELMPVLEKREAEGNQTPFEEVNLTKRINPFLIMPNVKTILVAATSYHYPETKMESNRLTGTLARFSRGIDYHQTLHYQLKELALELRKLAPELDWVSHVDSGPLVERYLAAQAGLGVYGRNNCLIANEWGSFVVLGLLLINLPVEKSVACKVDVRGCNDCGSCQKACPTNALETPYRIKKEKCLSYLLQSREQIPVSYRVIAGKQLYGCDICQDICPFNEKAPYASASGFGEYDGFSNINLTTLLDVSNRQFNRLYRQRSFGWRGQKIMQRNALMALGNSGDPEAIQYLTPFIHHHRQELREMAEWALQRIHATTGRKGQET